MNRYVVGAGIAVVGNVIGTNMMGEHVSFGTIIPSAGFGALVMLLPGKWGYAVNGVSALIGVGLASYGKELKAQGKI